MSHNPVSMDHTDNFRANRLNKHFDTIIHGRQTLTLQNNSLFLEAICAVPDVATCIDKIIASEKGLDCLRASMRFDLSPTFFNGPASTLLRYLSLPELATISRGDFLRQVLFSIVEPPIFWNAFRKAFQAGQLQENGQLGFAWLLLQLISLPGESSDPYRTIAQDPAISDTLLSSSCHDIRTIAQKIKHAIAMRNTGASVDIEYGPGGRHDNDFVNFRDIAILPTPDELMSKEKPFLRTSNALDESHTEESLLPTHLDNQFRLLREDMLYEMRENLHIALGVKKSNHRGFVLDKLTVKGIHYMSPNDHTRMCKWGITLQCHYDLWQLKDIKPKDRKIHLEKNRNIFRHKSMACLLVNEEVVAFPTVNRDEELLARKPPIIVLQLEGQKSVSHTLLKLHNAEHIRLLQIDTAIFAYEPILKALQEKPALPLSPELLLWTEGSIMRAPQNLPTQIVEAIKANPRQDFRHLLKTSRHIYLDQAQADSLLSGLTQRVSLIQGPPGTGKSFIGALIAKILHDFAKQTILVVCYTNHALDQFLEDLLNIGIPETSIIRLGGKSTPRTAALALQKQKKSGFKRTRADWKEIDDLKVASNILAQGLDRGFEQYKFFNPQLTQLLEHLEFDHGEYFEAFGVPQSTDGMQQVGRKGKVVQADYLLNRWAMGSDAGIFKGTPHVRKASEIWKMPKESRQTRFDQWKQEMLGELIKQFCETADRYNDCQTKLDRKFSESDAVTLCSKRIIACTTTGAAKYREDISAARPGVLLVEEAGEIHESHILTALAAETGQLILIGDHKQLRPKVNNYLLTVEKGEGFDLNRSLFERLVLKGYPHKTLREQHRMRPEISKFVRELTYPDLLDAAKTQNRPDLRGVRDNVVFINHDHQEDEVSQLEERRDMNSKSSKKNKFEVAIVLKIVRYLAQQGYGTDKIVVLTPYLGQLRELQEALKKDNDPVLNDLDSYDLVRAGILSSSAAKITKNPIRLATIDNYQGEESDIVIVSLTRSNAARDIGFMSSPQRLTVLLSRARDALIMIGNAHTFMNARKGSDIWTKLLDMFKLDGHVYDGLPVRCERHVDRMTLLKCPDDFDTECPDGGCLEPCNIQLKCGHFCPFKCHQLSDHSKMPCDYLMYSNCPEGHRQQWKCQKGPPSTCAKCDYEKKMAEKKQKEEFALQEKRDAKQRSHAREIAELETQITRQREDLRDAQLAKEYEDAVEQKKRDLVDITALATQASSLPQINITPPLTNIIQGRQSLPKDHSDQGASKSSTKPVGQSAASNEVKSAARERWQRQKEAEGATNVAIDAVMAMTGLEAVKDQVLAIKDKVDTANRQGSSLKSERFNVCMLGNPGTGKTTVARHYGKFLSSVGVIPGNMFHETTGSRLANDGVPSIKKTLEGIINAGGGTIFVDEAYQLTSDHNFQGNQVLDFLLAEMENNVGKIAFIFAGYNQEMEKFFEHNPGLISRVPYSFQFKDYEDAELLDMLEDLINKTWKGKMKVDGEDGIRGLYGRIAVRRLGRGRGRKGFGNARALANMFSIIRERQAKRISAERRQGLHPDDFLLFMEDLIGPDPSKVMVESEAWKGLQSMIGLGAVKKSITNLFAMANTNYQRELLEKQPTQISLNRIFLGSPGTGKTTAAKYYGQILVDLGFLSKGEIVIKNPADFIGSALGHSESQTKAILANTVGKVLIIDEAYMLYEGSGTRGNADPFKTAVIDTIVAEVQSVPGEDRCVLLLGYKRQIEEMFQNVNPGLARRFAIEDAFHFHDYTDSELLQALEWKLGDQDLTATDSAKAVAMEVLSRARNRPNFGNIGEIENILSQAKVRYQARQSSLPIEQRSPDTPLEPQDFDPDFNRNEHAAANLEKLFEDVVGCEEIIKKLGGWQQMARNMKARGRDPREYIPTNFIFKGPPGTGKTTTARKLGQVFYDMGFLSSTEVVECSVSDLVGEYVGHTGPKTQKVFERALGRVLFIDEAYRLSEGHFAKEAIDEVVGIMTQESFRSKLIVILAGYDREMNELMAVNTGLSSRFPEEIVFKNLTPEKCAEILKRKLKKQSIQVDALEDRSLPEYTQMINLLQQLSLLPAWGNARDMDTLSKQMMATLFTSLPMQSDVTQGNSDDLMTFTGKQAVACIESMLCERQERARNVPIRHDPGHVMQQMLDMHHAPPPPPTIRTTQTNEASVAPTPQPSPKEEVTAQSSDSRDAGVTDQVWNELQIDKQIVEEAARRSQENIQLLQQELRDVERREEAARFLAKKLAESKGEQAGLMRKREEARLREHAEKIERSRITAALEAEEKKRREEARVQKKLCQMGVCPIGYRWIKQLHGYRCAGGSHFIDNAALGI